MLSRLSLILLALVGSLPPGETQAAVIAYDGFESYTASSTLAGQNGGTSWSGAWGGTTGPTVASGGLSYSAGSITINGGNRKMSIGETNADLLIGRDFSSTQGSIWFSFLLQPNSNLSGDFLQVYLTDSTSDDSRNSGAMGIFNTSLGARLTAGSNGGGSTTTDNPSPTVPPVSGTTYLLVGRLYASGGAGTNFNTFDFYLNPTSTTLGTPSVSITRDTLTSTIAAFGIRTVNLDTGESAFLDELRIGQASVDVIPEPSAGALALLPIAALLYRRTRSRR